MAAGAPPSQNAGTTSAQPIHTDFSVNANGTLNMLQAAREHALYQERERARIERRLARERSELVHLERLGGVLELRRADGGGDPAQVVFARVAALRELAARADPGVLRARVAGVGEELREIDARLLVELPVDVRLRERPDDLVEQRLHRGVVAVLVRARHRVLEELHEALDRLRAAHRVVEALHPRLGLVLVGAAGDGRAHDGERGGC